MRSSGVNELKTESTHLDSVAQKGGFSSIGFAVFVCKTKETEMIARDNIVSFEKTLRMFTKLPHSYYHNCAKKDCF